MANLEVAVVSPYEDPNAHEGSPADSGLLWYTRNFATALARVALVHVVTHRSSERAWNDGSVRVHAVYRRGSWFAPLQALVWIARSKCSVVHVQQELFAFGNPACALVIPFVSAALRALGRRVTTTVHGVIPLDSIDESFVRKNGSRLPASVARWGWRLLIRATCATSHCVIVHEESHRQSLLSEYGVRTPVVVIPLVVPLVTPLSAAERIDARKAMEIDPSAEVLLFFGYLAGYKGLDELCDAIPVLLEERPALHVIIAGEVPARLGGVTAVSLRLDALAAAHQRVHRVGYVPNAMVRGVFATADVLILPYTSGISASGPFSLAAAYGVPSIVSRYLRQDGCGTVAFHPDREGIVGGVNAFFGEAACRAQARGYMERVRRERSWDIVATRTLEAYGR